MRLEPLHELIERQMKRWQIIHYTTHDGREGLAVVGSINESPDPQQWAMCMFDPSTRETIGKRELSNCNFVLGISTIAHRSECWELVWGLPDTLRELEAMVLVEAL